MRLLPQDRAFFDLFDAQVEAVVDAAAALGHLADDKDERLRREFARIWDRAVLERDSHAEEILHA